MSGQGELLEKLKKLKAFSLETGRTARELVLELDVNRGTMYRLLRKLLERKEIQAGGWPTKYWVRKC